MATWAEMAHDNWQTIEDFPDLIAFADVKAMKQDRQLKEFQKEFIQQNLTEQQEKHQEMLGPNW